MITITKPSITIVLVFFLIAIVYSCTNDDGIAINSEEESSNPEENFVFEDGFETVNLDFNELFPDNESRWTNTQQTNPTNAINQIGLSTDKASEGSASLRIFANSSDSELSKIDIEKNGLNMASGQTVTITADFYIAGTNSIENLLLLDLECCTCWDPTVGDNLGAENQCPGIRLILSGQNGYLSIERGKIAGTTIAQNELAFPRNQWVSVLWEMTLSDGTNGINKLSINNNQVINTSGMNMPNAQVFTDLFAQEGIEFNLQQPVVYERVQIGATAHPTSPSVELFVDNFSLVIN